jgi:hypothetical protein
MNTKYTSPLMINLILIIVILLAAGCSSAAPAEKEKGGPAAPVVAPASKAPPPQPDMYDRHAWDSYAALFQIQFNGPVNWTYRLKTRKLAGLSEYDLHIEGISGAQNPGDIRMVTDGETTWMKGPGTDNECIQFPNGAGMDPQYLSPEELFDAKKLNSQVKLLGEEPVNGVSAQHFQQKGGAFGPWKNAEIDIWAEKSSKMLMLFTFKAQGADPFFETGSGEVSAIFATSEAGSQPIALISGCEVPVPLPETVEMYVRLPGMVSFETPTSAADLQRFYQVALPQEEWSENEPVAQGDNATVLSYRRGAEVVQIQILPWSKNGSKVQILFLSGQ